MKNPSQSTTLHSAGVAVDAVAALYPAEVIKPSSPEFIETLGSFWDAKQQQRAPACFFRPNNAAQVRAAIVEVARAKCRFAIKGGGHSASVASSCLGGFQFDLANLNHIEISQDKKTVKVGPGVHWGPLLQTLEKHGVIAVGGRDFGVGVPGFIFGGGISYLSAQYGWGIDNLVSVDLVLANGDLVTADKSSHPDLFKALHGGGAHNFGIATSLTLKLYPYQGMWGGMNVVAGKHADAVFDEYDLFTRELVKDGKAHMIMDFTWQGDQIIAIQFMGYPEPKDNPAIYDGFRRLPNLQNTLRLADYSSLASEMADMTDTQGKRNAYWTLAMEYNINLLKSIYELWAQTTRPYATRFQLAMDVNHITPAMRNKAAREGVGNLYGLEGPEFPLTNILLTNIWEDEADGEEAMALLRKLGANFEALAKQRGKAIPFKYMNYAHQDQDVIQGFGQQNASFLKDIGLKYDPEGIFQTLQPGGFKLAEATQTSELKS